jgi:GNAT superfamily N-acetyltransferase
MNTELIQGERVCLKDATEGDAPVILAALRGLADDLNMAADFAATEGSVRRALAGDHPSIEALIAECETGWAGVAVFFQTHSAMLARPVLFLDDLYVRPECRSMGVGHELMKGLVEIAIARGCLKIEWLVPKWNARAMQFYERKGATVLDERYRCRLDENAIRRLNCE